jgi:D-amino-acid dehydrogenase
MPKSSDKEITVIGAGIVGICCACYLQRSGFEVTLVDREEPAMQTSFGNAGGISPGSVTPLGMPGMWKQIPRWLLDDNAPLVIKGRYLPKALPWLARFALQSRTSRVRQISKALVALNSPTFDAYQPLLEDAALTQLFHRSGQLFLYRNRQDMDKDTLTHELRSEGGASIEFLNAEEIREIEPAITPIFESGYLMPENGHCKDPFGLANSLVKMFVNKGGVLVKADVLDFIFDADGVSGLSTSSVVLNTRRVVIAAGIWSKTLCERLGLPVPLESHRGYHATIENSNISLRHMCFPVDYKFAITPMSMGLRIAGTVEFAGLGDPPNYERVNKMVKSCHTILNGLNSEYHTQWMGHRPCLPDSLPIIGESRKHPNIFFAFGHGHQGLVGASQTGKVIAEIARDVVPSMNLGPFCIDRF